MINRKRFSGVIVGFEETSSGTLVYVYGNVEGVEEYFYVKLKKEKLEELLRLGIGQYIEGEGEIQSNNPLIIEE